MISYRADFVHRAGGAVPICLLAAGPEGRCLGPISPDCVSQAVYDALEEEWAAWDALGVQGQMLSSHLPGCCRRDFDGWAECEEFLGFSIPNPLEGCPWLEQGTYVAMPVGFRDAPRVQASWYGTRDGHVEWIAVEAGYRKDDVRVMVMAAVYGEAAEEQPSDGVWSVELRREDYLAEAGGAVLQVTSELGERYFSSRASQAQGPVLYCFNIVGEPDAREQVEEVWEQVVEYFFSEAG